MNLQRGIAVAAGLLLLLVVSEHAAAEQGAFPWKAGDNPPAVTGIVLGDTEQHVQEVLNRPASKSKMGDGDVLEYPAMGLQIIATPADGVSIIRLRAPQAGSIDGIKIGDDVGTVLAKWGPPHSGQGRVALYNAGVWTVEVRLADTEPKVVDILLAWNTTKWPDMDPSKGQIYRPQ